MDKIYVLDTNVLLHDPNSIYSFQENEVIIPMIVVEELDGKKTDQNEIGRNAREVSRKLDALRKKNKLNQGVELKNGGTLRTVDNHQHFDKMPKGLSKKKADNRILATVLGISEDYDKETILVSKDMNMRIKGDIIGFETQNYTNDKVDIDNLYEGFRKLDTEERIIDNLFSDKTIDLSKIDNDLELNPNEILNLKNGSQSAFAINKNDKLKLINSNQEFYNIRARNREQTLAFELLNDDSIKAVSLVGKAGTGKTLLALAVALENVYNSKDYDKIVVGRPVMPMGKDIGYLPGDKADKLKPWVQPIYDNLELLLDDMAGNNIEEKINSLKDYGLLELQALAHIRGRSLPNQFLIIDEAQNLTPHEIKTIITRAGEGTKVILTGDPYQIDHPYLDSDSNGLTYFVDKTKDKELTGHITLTKGERSPLAQMGTDIL